MTSQVLQKTRSLIGRHSKSCTVEVAELPEGVPHPITAVELLMTNQNNNQNNNKNSCYTTDTFLLNLNLCEKQGERYNCKTSY